MCRWVNTEKAVHTQEHSCCLPEDDIEPAFRKSDLDHKRTEYELDLKLEDCLPQVRWFSTVHADGLVPLGARASTDTVITNYWNGKVVDFAA